MGLAVTNRALFVTDDGKMGLGPASIAKGDKIYILPGGRLPFVLRNVEPPENLDDRLYFARSKAYTVVGDCFFHGAMDCALGFSQQGSLPMDVLENVIGEEEMSLLLLSGVSYFITMGSSKEELKQACKDLGGSYVYLV
jgi:hypothetical protein